MIPAIAVPTAQVPPPVDASAFNGQMSDPAVGRLPFNTVAPPINGQKVADDQRGNQQASKRQTPDAPSSSDVIARLTGQNSSDIRLVSPFSAPFMAQLFGQISLKSDVVGGLFGEGSGVPAGFVDFERLAEFDQVKYKPSGAFEPRETPALQKALQAAPAPDLSSALELGAAEVGTVATQGAVDLKGDVSLPKGDAALMLPKAEGAPIPTSIPAQEPQPQPELPSSLSQGLNAYLSTQSRNDGQISTPRPEGAQEISLFM